ncbi:MAG: hypothetical protein HDT33_05675 [Clostridiales bacterium]|nr:hypothetical protein [Clostridiales bacterium]
MDMLENKNTQKRRMPAVAKIALVAALAVGCVLSIAAGLPAQVYNAMTGGSMTYSHDQFGSHITITFNEEDCPLVLENGRLIFVNGEEHTDITDLVDENTPFIYEHTDPATGTKGYVVVGGTPEDFGWVECSRLGMYGNNFCVGDEYRPWFLAANEQLGILEQLHQGI